MFITEPIRWLLLYKQLTTTEEIHPLHVNRKSVQSLKTIKEKKILTELVVFPCTRILHFVSKSQINPYMIIPQKKKKNGKFQVT